MLFSSVAGFCYKKKNGFIILSLVFEKSRWNPPLAQLSLRVFRSFRIAAQEDHWLLGRIASSSSRYVLWNSTGRCTVNGMAVARLITRRGNVWAVTNTRDQSCPNGAPECIACNGAAESNVTARQTSCAESICPSALIIHRVCSMHFGDETRSIEFDYLRMRCPLFFSVSRADVNSESSASAFK